MTERALPAITPETRHFWEGTRTGELRLQKCGACDHVYFPPRPFCPQCGSSDVSVFRASGRATLYSYVIHHRPVPGFVPPYSIAVVEPEELRLDMPLEVVFQRINDEIFLPLFRPAGRDA
jgi:uncharacterized OB-fold protein